MDLITWFPAFGLFLLIGVSLGLLGGGGSILTVPILVYVLGLSPKEAIATSLLVVAVTSSIATIQHARRGRVWWKVGLVFSASGMLGAFGGGFLAQFIPGALLLILFAAIMFATAVAMLKGAGDCANYVESEESERHLCSLGPREILHTLFHGLVVGGVTGLVGAGGGFLIVPALHLLGGLPMRAAIGTSLMVISLKSYAALVGYLVHLSIDLKLASVVTAAAVLGSFFGAWLARFLNACYLRKLFGYFVITMAFYMLFKQKETLIALWRYLVALFHCFQKVPFPKV